MLQVGIAAGWNAGLPCNVVLSWGRPPRCRTPAGCPLLSPLLSSNAPCGKPRAAHCVALLLPSQHLCAQQSMLPAWWSFAPWCSEVCSPCLLAGICRWQAGLDIGALLDTETLIAQVLCSLLQLRWGYGCAADFVGAAKGADIRV